MRRSWGESNTSYQLRVADEIIRRGRKLAEAQAKTQAAQPVKCEVEVTIDGFKGRSTNCRLVPEQLKCRGCNGDGTRRRGGAA